MKRHIISLLFAGLISLLVSANSAEAQVKTSATSAALISERQIIKTVDKRTEILTAFLKSYGSPLVDSASTFIEEADRNNLDWKLVVSISGVESWFGQRIPPNSYNGWGWGVYGTNVHHFNSWDEGIIEISHSLRSKYMNRWGAKDVYGIGRFYAADPKWAIKVSSFMEKLSYFENKYVSSDLSISI